MLCCTGFPQRIFKHFPIPLTIPENNQLFTARLRPGVESFVLVADEVVTGEGDGMSAAHSSKHQLDATGLEDHLEYLIRYAKNQLLQYKDQWASFPLYFRATGAVRAMPPAARTLLMDHVRLLLSNDTFCPFYFQFDSARVLSGEEEAVYAWTAANFLHDRLLPDLTASTVSIAPSSTSSPMSHGAVIPVASAPPTFGTLDLGATSSQLSFFVPSQDVSQGLFKLQLGMYEHWNLYANSLLQFGYDSARLRHLKELAHQVVGLFLPFSAVDC